MAFSFGIELLNMVMRKRMKDKRIVQLNEPVLDEKREPGSDMAK
jgi:hypothetical protein